MDRLMRFRWLVIFFVVFVLVSPPLESSAKSAWYQKYGIRSKQALVRPRAVPALIKALKSRDAGVRKSAVRALARIGAPAHEAVGELTVVLKTDPHPRVRAEAVLALVRVAGREQGGIVPLVEALGDKDAKVRRTALEQLLRAGCKTDDFISRVRRMADGDPHRKVKALAKKVLVKLAVRSKDDRTPPPEPPEVETGRAVESSETAAPLPSRSIAENRYAVAVIIGNRNYSANNRDVPDVDYAENDARAMRDYVTGSLGYRAGNVIYLKDATQADLVGTFGTGENPRGKLFDWVRPGKSDVFVYYSGHGAPGISDGQGYLLPVDGDPMKVELVGYPLKTLYANLAKIPARSTTVVLDACFSGASANGAVVLNASSISLKLIETEPVIPKATILTAAGLSEIASWDKSTGHGLFTSYFLKGVGGAADQGDNGNGDGRVTLAELKKYLGEEVAYTARRLYGRDQNPQVSGDLQRIMQIN